MSKTGFLISAILWAIIIGGIMAATSNSADASERRPFSRCEITINDSAAILFNNCKHGNIVTSNIPKGIDPIKVASRVCNFRYTITHTDTSMACVFGLVRK